MHQPIKTAWHKIVPLIDADEVYLAAPKGAKAPHWGQFNPRVESFKNTVRSLGTLPKFVIDDDLLDIVRGEEYQLSILDMHRAGVLRLPFAAMTVEFQIPAGRALVVLRDNAFKERLPWEVGPEEDPGNTVFWSKPFYGVPLRIEHDTRGEYLVMSAGVISIDIQEQNGMPWIGITAQGHDIIDMTQPVLDMIKHTYQKEGSLIWQALACAFLVLHTEGVKKEVIECSKINRKRIASKKEPIPRHTVVSIGKVYRSASSGQADDYEPRRSPRPHWRRGHLKNVHYGPGRASVKQKYINPKLVAFKEFEGAEPLLQEYHVKP